MSKILVMARREYLATVRTKAFMVSLILMPFFMGGAIILQKLLEGRVDTDKKTIAVIDASGAIAQPLAEAVARYNKEEIRDRISGKQISGELTLEIVPAQATDAVRLDLSNRIRKHEIYAFIEIPADVLNVPDSVLAALGREIKSGAQQLVHGGPGAREIYFYSEGSAMSDAARWLQRSINQVIQSVRLKRAGIDVKVVDAAMSRVEIETLGLYDRTPTGEIRKAEKRNREATFFVPMGVMMLMFMLIMVAAQPMLQSVLEEKQQRIAEVLLGSASPFQIMMGKLLGNVGISLTIAGIYVVGGYWMLDHYNLASMVPKGLMLWFVVFQVLAVLHFGAIFIAIGAACTELKEAQNFMTPVMLTLIMPMMIWFVVLKEPLSSFSTIVSLIPPCTPMLMIMRMVAAPSIPTWQPLLGIVLVLLFTVASVFAAGRIFRIGLLAQGKAPRMSELIRWAVHG